MVNLLNDKHSKKFSFSFTVNHQKFYPFKILYFQELFLKKMNYLF